jgi:hypothetical protein
LPFGGGGSGRGVGGAFGRRTVRGGLSAAARGSDGDDAGFAAGGTAAASDALALLVGGFDADAGGASLENVSVARRSELDDDARPGGETPGRDSGPDDSGGVTAGIP